MAKKRDRLRTVNVGPTEYLTTGPKAFPPGIQSWPVVAAYRPLKEAWEATGLGVGALVRQQPDGQVAYLLVLMDLHDGIVSAVSASANADPAWFRDLMEKTEMSPWQESTAEDAADFLRGALAANAQDPRLALPALDVRLALGILPPSRHSDPARWFLEPGGPTPMPLLQMIAQMPPIAELGQGKETLLVTSMVFRLRNQEHALQVLANNEAFVAEKVPRKHPGFLWTRTHPTRIYSPHWLDDTRQLTGRVEVTPDRLRAEAISRTHAARLVDILKRALGDEIELRTTRWEPYQPGSIDHWME